MEEAPALQITVVGTPLTASQQIQLLSAFTRAHPNDLCYQKKHFIGSQQISLSLIMAMLRKEKETRLSTDYTFTRVFILIFDAHAAEWHREILKPRDDNTAFTVALVDLQNTDVEKLSAFAQQNNIPAVIRCALDNPRSIDAMLDLAVIGGLTVRNDKITQPCCEYFKRKKLDGDFIESAITLCQFDSTQLNDDPLKLILLWLAKLMKLPGSEKKIKDTIELIVSNIRDQPRSWKTQYNGLTLFKKNTHITPEPPLLTPTALTY
ncbi:MAG TPA: hypothetical protein VGV92_09445 [Gammaproteobacteria bacterium]|nr:hypothetical protein [Gammaproteobacteria bacterium]